MSNDPPTPKKSNPFRRAVLHGLGVVLPPLLTIVLFIWAWAQIDNYVLKPVESLLHTAISTYGMPKIHANKPADTNYSPVGTGEHRAWIPSFVIQTVQDKKAAGSKLPETARGYYDRYIRLNYLRRDLVIPVFLSVFVLLLYLAGKLLALGIGRFFVGLFERLIDRLPVIRNVYSSVKQVTDFAFKERETPEFSAVVAVEYPRKGIFSIGFVTGSGMKDIMEHAGEPILSVLMPTSPMPATGFTISVRKSETVDLDISIDQAIQYVVSCGVVVPDHQQWERIEERMTNAVANIEESAESA